MILVFQIMLYIPFFVNVRFNLLAVTVVFRYFSLPHQEVASELQKTIDGYIKFANSSDEAYAHIEAEVSCSLMGVVSRLLFCFSFVLFFFLFSSLFCFLFLFCFFFFFFFFVLRSLTYSCIYKRITNT